jgi:hypothetical protein
MTDPPSVIITDAGSMYPGILAPFDMIPKITMANPRTMPNKDAISTNSHLPVFYSLVNGIHAIKPFAY